ncbi:fimbrial protein [Xenorhabdus lircayensis]|uniref:Uncharacterized protein n=1 Tax=Xenorhabdus lircayensis TaxID=2763499 RepID=A0ABS0U8Q6_9GAMM|nr:hypothetical protein [Xenorhabdus lircayensis]MBI6550258.1 hypothetical protein [Xenorhabdus lircayensis]
MNNCDWQQEGVFGEHVPVRVTFEGIHDKEPHLFHLAGSAKGAALTIRDSQGYLVRAGESQPVISSHKNASGIKYTLNLAPNGEPLTSGNYYAALSFKLNYE